MGDALRPLQSCMLPEPTGEARAVPHMVAKKGVLIDEGEGRMLQNRQRVGGMSDVEWIAPSTHKLCMMLSPPPPQHPGVSTLFGSFWTSQLNSSCRSKETHWRLGGLWKDKGKYFLFPLPSFSICPCHSSTVYKTVCFGTVTFCDRERDRIGL